ncbi:unnamed protein product [Microthlaspi erraticum]|uniref:PUM-HD domain-containing protein n=1 Tax=Microthlaspi erraticum TaxID=1685480 RepID=A0A6D2IUI4_9BRAS|nr:unnamed protein product [Microthlaspi erraticum]
MANSDPFSLSSMLNALPNLRLPAARETMKEEIPVFPPPPRGVRFSIPPPGFAPPKETNLPIAKQPLNHPCFCGFRSAFTPQEMRLQWMFHFMTNSEEDDVAPFRDMNSMQRMASLLTSDSDYFMAIARNKNGSKRLQKLLGKSDDADSFFADAILHRFLHMTTDKHASHVAIKGMRVFDKDKKEAMYHRTLHFALDLARDLNGCVALNEIITDLDHPYYRNQILDLVVDSALSLSNDVYGNFVIQHVLKLNDLRCTRNIAVNLRGHCVDLSFKKYGSYIVERILEVEESMVVVMSELLECEGDRLMRLARSGFGNFVVAKALRVLQENTFRAFMFWRLVDKLMPFLHLLRRSRGSNIAAILESYCKPASN